jgi:hypothetical protein
VQVAYGWDRHASTILHAVFSSGEAPFDYGRRRSIEVDV